MPFTKLNLNRQTTITMSAFTVQQPFRRNDGNALYGHGGPNVLGTDCCESRIWDI